MKDPTGQDKGPACALPCCRPYNKLEQQGAVKHEACSNTAAVITTLVKAHKDKWWRQQRAACTAEAKQAAADQLINTIGRPRLQAIHDQSDAATS